ncbi:MAG: 2-C-methyl-D-erythritol 4-phosphate cytidylyltransferase [Roseburia sp.]|uniref:2-C-methyl-D-erythritol 4-phosphate cytidylyltransferase n=1 Tax=Roseburia hominis TaxID=301301 RepID=UPI001F221493|nr:2-C-methyl-D-erythritol 4-phosphate cytidylyltransferase [Roseburia hominis]MCI5712611.1 2-C-methyl-D-erythritol 4-phosphate cytidylyltransferase [Lachnospiraceae bacterium]MDY4840581.1 2-C-methyl-D-erythritol 4-phosphate cytidylyltransferase [Lachnospiraceae bacterium]
MKKEKVTAIVLAAGQGTRMGGKTAKQYLLLDGRPVLYYALLAFEKSMVDEIILVAGEKDLPFCRTEIVEKYGFSKVTRIVAGGKERYHSVYQGLKAAGGADYVLIHDGARPFVSDDIISRTIEAVKKEKACVVAMPVKDTIKIANEDHYAIETPNRSKVWMIQTPQAFSYDLILHAYEKVLASGDAVITDDAMVLEKAENIPVKLVQGSYTNIKITTPEDMKIAEIFLKDR